MSAIRLVLLDLDGTLADTAPDLAGAVNAMLRTRGRPPVPLAELRPLASHGARGMLGRAFGVTPEMAEYEPLRQEFFAVYQQALHVETVLFPGMDAALRTLEERGVAWGVVTNKPARFTDPLMAALALATRAACVVSGDTTPHAKPHPAPLLEALRRCDQPAAAALYVGDDLRDIQAGRAAGLRTVVASYGYLGDPALVPQWQADFHIDTPAALLPLVLPAR